MPDHFDIVGRALEHFRGTLDAAPIAMTFTGRQGDSAVAARAVSDAGAACAIVLGGDGTNRIVATAIGDVPVVAVSTGTNNALPTWIDGTTAGIAAGLIARRRVDLDTCAPHTKRLDLTIARPDGSETADIALVDAAIIRARFVGARAVWDARALDWLFLARGEPGAIGLSAIGAHLEPIGPDDDDGLWLTISDEPGGECVRAPIVPGIVETVCVSSHGHLAPDTRFDVRDCPGVLALDGEREHEIGPHDIVTVRLSRKGPRLVKIRETIASAARRGAFRVPAQTESTGARQ